MGRRRVHGRVIAVWNNNTVLLDTDFGITKVQLIKGMTPRYGMAVDAVGIVETDLYHLNLSRAIWRKTKDSTAFAPPEPERVSAAYLLTERKGHLGIKHEFHGKAIRLRGTVRTLQATGDRYERFDLECGDLVIPVHCDSVPAALAGVMTGCEVDVAGTCVMDIENWRPQMPFPHIEGMSLVLRTPNDIRILTRPSWWTPGRLIAVIGILLTTLVGILAWNRILRNLIEKRSRQLLRAQVAQVESVLRIEERTRLAVELHDSISQNLTGVALEMNAANHLADTDGQKMRAHLEIATKALNACRNEVRNCIWDLRSRALETSDMNGAIRCALAPHIGTTDLSVRFSIPRKRISDNTAHAILRIIRELSVNAVRHGGASAIRIAGSIEDGKMKFSVRDNGRGFDPTTCPGAQQGHFGLLGIRERVDTFEGSMDVSSVVGSGTRMTITLSVPKEEEEQMQCKKSRC